VSFSPVALSIISFQYQPDQILRYYIPDHLMAFPGFSQLFGIGGCLKDAFQEARVASFITGFTFSSKSEMKFLSSFSVLALLFIWQEMFKNRIVRIIPARCARENKF
jgi:hypothetical protein